MLDNSASTAIKKQNYQGLKSYKDVLDELNFSDSLSVNFDFLSIGSDTKPTSLRKLTFNADQTNLSKAVQAIKENKVQANAAVIVTDGIFTEGENPVFEASETDIPIFIIGLGDTTSQKDALVKSVVTNSTGYLDTEQTVKVMVSSTGFKGKPFQLRLQKNNKIIDTKTITPKLPNSTQEVSFELPLNEEGLHQFKVVIPELSDEWTTENNSQLFSVNVMDAKQQILSLAFEIYPDVSFVRSLLLADRHVQLTNRTWLRDNRFIEGPLSFDADTIDLAVIHGFPPSGLPDNIQQVLVELAEKVPLIIAATPKFNPQSFKREVTSLPVTASASWQYLPVSISPRIGSGHPILELPSISFDQIPPLFAPVQNLSVTPGAKNLFSSRYQDQAASKSVLAVQETGSKRRAIFTGFGWFRLDQNQNPQLREFVRRLWLNVVSWAATDPDNQKLKVQTSQTSFSETEPVIINAFLKNERGEVESQASVDISISSDSANTKSYSLENRGSGEYRLKLGALPQGLYSFKATAKKGNRILETQTGEFSVARSNAEFINTKRNDQLLRQLSQRTGGVYMPFDSVSGFWNHLEKQGLLNQTEEMETSFWYPYQHLIWFLLVLVLLSSEWIFRKYLSLP